MKTRRIYLFIYLLWTRMTLNVHVRYGHRLLWMLILTSSLIVLDAFRPGFPVSKNCFSTVLFMWARIKE